LGAEEEMEADDVAQRDEARPYGPSTLLDVCAMATALNSPTRSVSHSVAFRALTLSDVCTHIHITRLVARRPHRSRHFTSPLPSKIHARQTYDGARYGEFPQQGISWQRSVVT
jgi:hypothetical protein